MILTHWLLSFLHKQYKKLVQKPLYYVKSWGMFYEYYLLHKNGMSLH